MFFLKERIMETFLGVDIYRFLLKSPIHFGKIIFKPDVSIQIAVSGEGGGGGFSPVIIYNILIKNKTGSDSFRFKEMHLYHEETPIVDFVTKNIGVLFEKVN